MVLAEYAKRMVLFEAEGYRPPMIAKMLESQGIFVAVQSPFVFNPFYGQPARSINQVNGLGSARNLKRASY